MTKLTINEVIKLINNGIDNTGQAKFQYDGEEYFFVEQCDVIGKESPNTPYAIMKYENSSLSTICPQGKTSTEALENFINYINKREK